MKKHMGFNRTQNRPRSTVLKAAIAGKRSEWIETLFEPKPAIKNDRQHNTFLSSDGGGTRTNMAHEPREHAERTEKNEMSHPLRGDFREYKGESVIAGN